jgi:hypothetical protein
MTAARYGPISLLVVWAPPSAPPLSLVTNLGNLDAALAHYRKRAHLETFFSDQKRRGCHLHKSRLRDPARLSRLLIAAGLAYLWVVSLGVCARRDDWLPHLHRPDRCDLSLFRLGRRRLARCLKDEIPIPDGLLVPAVAPPARLPPTPAQVQAA